MERDKESVVKTLLYFQIFNYPLQKKEIWQFLDEKISKIEFEKIVKGLPHKSSFYYLNGKSRNILKRKRREIYSELKIKKAVNVIKKMIIIPSIQFIGISGSLSMRNSDRGDDIDIFVISKSGFVWLTRLLIVLYLKLLGIYRSNNDKNIKDKFCLNFIIGENKMRFDGARRNLYSAHEIVQLLPIFQRDNIYEKFIENNNWIVNFLPNFKDRIAENALIISKKTSSIDRIILKLSNLLYLEIVVRFIQYVYMKPKVTQEEIGKDILAFHPQDYQKIVFKKLLSSNA